MKRNNWYVVKGQSLAKYASASGFDLALYDGYSDDVKEELKKCSIKNALWEIKYACEMQDCDLASIKDGVYVISLSNPLSIQYRGGRSQVIYIGLGNIVGRIETHFKRSLFEFMLSLSGANFDFHFARPGRPGPSTSYYKHVEHCMLEYFSEQYGGMDDKRRFPLLNKNAGSRKTYSEDTEWWKKPLKAVGRRPQWEIKPTDYSDFAPLDAKGD